MDLYDYTGPRSAMPFVHSYLRVLGFLLQDYDVTHTSFSEKHLHVLEGFLTSNSTGILLDFGGIKDYN